MLKFVKYSSHFLYLSNHATLDFGIKYNSEDIKI